MYNKPRQNSQESGVRSQESRVKIQEPGVRSQDNALKSLDWIIGKGIGQIGSKGAEGGKQ